MKLFMIYGRDDGARGDVFRTYLIAAPSEAAARGVVPTSFEIMSVEATDTTDKDAHALFATEGQIELIDW